MTTATAVKNNVVWFEIPSNDFKRAVTSARPYSGKNCRQWISWVPPTAVFAYEKPAVSGCVLREEAVRPGLRGSVVYLNADGIPDEVLARVPKAAARSSDRNRGVDALTAVSPASGLPDNRQHLSGRTAALARPGFSCRALA